jgi:hypothetical protein
VATFLRAIVSVVFLVLALVVCPAATLGAAPQEPAEVLPGSLGRIRERLAKTPPTRLKFDRPMPVPVATFKTRVDQRVYVLSLDEWLEKEFKLTTLQRQSADWAAKCCGGYVLGTRSFGVRLDPLFASLDKALQRRRLRKIREQIAAELAQVETARTAGLQDTR